jgi:hypothetical protein
MTSIKCVAVSALAAILLNVPTTTFADAAYGPVPPGMIVMHWCDNPACYNDLHLTLGTHADNAADKVAKGRQPTKLTIEQIQAIRRDTRKVREIAADYGIHFGQVSRIRNRRQWAWL